MVICITREESVLFSPAGKVQTITHCRYSFVEKNVETHRFPILNMYNLALRSNIHGGSR